MATPTFKRNIEDYLSDLLKQFPAVAIIGARQVGKTTLARRVAHNFTYIDLERPADYDRLTSDPDFFFKQHPSHIIFDEAQELPKLFSVLRGIIDEDRSQMGRFILTGSSSPELMENISESLAGRIAIIELGTLKANEYYQQPLSEFYNLFHQPLSTNNIDLVKPKRSMLEVQNFWLKGGYPEALTKPEKYYQEWMIDYESTYINRDIARLFPKLDKIAFRRFISMLGKLSSKIINKSELARSIGVTEPTIRLYLEIASGTFLWRTLPSFENNITKSIVKMPRGHICDSGLLHHLLRINSLEALQTDPVAGFSFEAFVIEEVLKGLQDSRLRKVEAYYYRTRGGSEIDLILKGPFGIVPIEIKYGTTILSRQLKSLNEFILTQKLPLGIVISQNETMSWLNERILHVPAGCL